jgi:uncharacterized protein (DUF2141 family)
MLQQRTRHAARRTTPRAAVRRGCMACVAVLVWTLLAPVVVAHATCPGMHVQIRNMRNSTGTVDCALFESPQGFPTEVLRSATNVMVHIDI